MKINYIVILAIMAVACYFLFIRKPRTRPVADKTPESKGTDTDTDL